MQSANYFQYVFITVALLAFGGGHLYIGSRLSAGLGLRTLGTRILWSAVGVSFLLQAGGSILYRLHDNATWPWHMAALSWSMYLLMGLFSLLTIALILVDDYRLARRAVRWCAAWRRRATPVGDVRSREPHNESTPPDVSPAPAADLIAVDLGRRRVMTGAVSLGVLAGTTTLCGVGFAQAMAGPRLRVTKIPLPGLPAAFEGLRIMQITDLHVGPTIRRRYVERMVAQALESEPDLLVMTGDMADGRVAWLSDELTSLRRLTERFPSFWVTGNHEYYWGVEGWSQEAERLGFTVLHNSHQRIMREGASLALAGVTDYNGGHFLTSHRSDPAGALAGAQDAAVKILLAHQPRSCFEAEQAGYHLQISGHTHGGQFIPWNFLVRLQQPFVTGLRRHGRLWVYVSPGVGYWGPPLRLGVPAELTQLVLTGRDVA